MSSSTPVTAESTVSSLPPSIPLRRDGGAADTMNLPGDAAWLVVAALMLAIAAATFWGRSKRRSPNSAAGFWRWRLGATDRSMPPGGVERVSSTRLSPRHSLHVVEWGGRRLLIGCTDHSMRLLSEAPVAGSGDVEDRA